MIIIWKMCKLTYALLNFLEEKQLLFFKRKDVILFQNYVVGSLYTFINIWSCVYKQTKGMRKYKGSP